MKHSTDSVITQTVAYLECSYFLVFTLALAYNQMTYSRQIVEDEMLKWEKKDIIPDWLGDFCLDILAKRITVNIALSGAIKYEPKRLESKTN